MTVRVKICGVTRLDDALAAAAAGADALGFNFWPGSKRFVAPEAARAIVERLPPFVTPVGLFVNQPRAAIAAAARASGISLLQLHGDEGPIDCEGHALPVVKALRIAGPADLDALARFPSVAAFLLDAPGEGFGGSGRTFDWSLARQASGSKPILLAGGLTPENVAAAVRAASPWAVDVSSGVEISPGVKDPDRVARFVRAAKEATA